MAAAKRYDRLAGAILNAIGPQDPNPSRHFRAVMLTPGEGAPSFAAADFPVLPTDLPWLRPFDRLRPLDEAG
jgi:hypothetical protein